MVKKVKPINYTSRNFDSLRNDLIEYTKRYYPNTYKDFNKSSFGSLMIDLVSYVGDNLSFYLDYNANESFIDTALEYENVVSHARQLGYEHEATRSSVGIVDVYIPVPALSSRTAPDLRYLPKIKKGSTVSNRIGDLMFTTTQDVDFYSSDAEIVGSEYSDDGTTPIYFILKAPVEVISGIEEQTTIEVGSYQRFLSIEIEDENITEILSVRDSKENEYYQVQYLSQNVIYKPFLNKNTDNNQPVSIMKPFPVARRFVVRRESNRIFLIFGYGSEEEIKKNKIADPSDVSLKMSGKNYVPDSSFDPTKLVSNEKFGISPANTSLTVRYRTNTATTVNSAVGTIVEPLDIKLEFANESNLSLATIDYIENNLQCYNEEPINGDVSSPTTEEIKNRVAGVFATQGRAVTLQDYKSSVYAMPAQFGSVKRCLVVRDDNDLVRNLNLYVISENSSGKLEKANTVLKQNLKTWLNSVRMISDSIDILDATIINISIEFEVIAQDSVNKNTVFALAKEKIYEDLTEVMPEIGEHFYISRIFKILKEIDEILDVVFVKVNSVSGGNYSSYQHPISANLSPEGRYLFIPSSHIWEIKYSSDIVGTVR